MFEKQTLLGYDLYQPFSEVDRWVLDFRDGRAFYGSFKEIAKYMVSDLCFDLEEIEIAVKHIFLSENHNGAHFGAYKTFIFSFYKEIDCEKKAS